MDIHIRKKIFIFTARKEIAKSAVPKALLNVKIKERNHPMSCPNCRAEREERDWLEKQANNNFNGWQREAKALNNWMLKCTALEDENIKLGKRLDMLEEKAKEQYQEKWEILRRCEKLEAALREAAPKVCSLCCPSVWKTAEGRPHHIDCINLRAALSLAPRGSEDEYCQDDSHRALHEASMFRRKKACPMCQMKDTPPTPKQCEHDAGDRWCDYKNKPTSPFVSLKEDSPTCPLCPKPEVRP